MTDKLKHINVTFTNSEYNKLLKEKNGTSWHDFILGLPAKNTIERISHSLIPKLDTAHETLTDKDIYGEFA